MVRFLSRLALLAAILLMVIIGMHAVAIWNMQDDVEAIYTIDPSTEVLFLGSSQVGCSIDEDEDKVYNLRKIWASYTIVPSCLMRLRELERRGQLDHIKTVVVPFNVNSVLAQNKKEYLGAWYRELPVSWRHMDLLPYSRLELAWYILCNLRYPFMMVLAEEPPEREGLASRPEAYRNKMLATFRRNARNVRAREDAPDDADPLCSPLTPKHLFGAYQEMSDICKRHGIRFVVYKAPLLPEFERNLPEETQKKVAAYEQGLREMHVEYGTPQIELDERHFFDDVHLIKSGAKPFTADLFRLLAHP